MRPSPTTSTIVSTIGPSFPPQPKHVPGGKTGAGTSCASRIRSLLHESRFGKRVLGHERTDSHPCPIPRARAVGGAFALSGDDLPQRCLVDLQCRRPSVLIGESAKRPCR